MMHDLYTIFDMAAQGHVKPATWSDSRNARTRMLAYRCFDNVYADEGGVMNLDVLRNYLGPRADMVDRGLPYVAWLFGQYEARDPEVVFVLHGERIPLSEAQRRFPLPA